MRFVARWLGFDAHLACIDIILDGVSIAHLVVLVLRVIVCLLEQAVSAHEGVVLHLGRSVLGGLCFPTAARERQPITRQKNFPAAVHHGSHAKRKRYTSSNTLEYDARISKPVQAQTKLQRTDLNNWVVK